jgi:1,4-dihydroxy-2-naphthoyl-CoA hydrolase
MRLWKQDTDLDRLNAWSRNTLSDALGMRITEIGDDYVRGTLPVDARTRQTFGLLHGGASVALAETLGSLAGNLCLDPDKELAVGLDINANHVRAATSGHVIGTARALHIGRSTQVWEIRIEDDVQRLVCISRLTLAVVPRQSLLLASG